MFSAWTIQRIVQLKLVEGLATSSMLYEKLDEIMISSHHLSLTMILLDGFLGSSHQFKIICFRDSLCAIKERLTSYCTCSRCQSFLR